MKRFTLPCAAAIMCTLFIGPPARAQNTTPPAVTSAEQADRALLYRLIRQVRRIDRDSEELMLQAMAEARNNGGSAEPETKARILSLRDQRDRLFSRLLILSMRHGWEIPDFDKPTVSRSSRQEAQHSVFGAVDSMVNKRFAADARRIAATLSLPVVSLASMTE